MKEINRAYEILSDPQKRKDYDLQESNENNNNHTSSNKNNSSSLKTIAY
jgi:DnaJ-class molecular chaperone